MPRDLRSMSYAALLDYLRAASRAISEEDMGFPDRVRPRSGKTVDGELKAMYRRSDASGHRPCSDWAQRVLLEKAVGLPHVAPASESRDSRPGDQRDLEVYELLTRLPYRMRWVVERYFGVWSGRCWPIGDLRMIAGELLTTTEEVERLLDAALRRLRGRVVATRAGNGTASTIGWHGPEGSEVRGTP